MLSESFSVEVRLAKASDAGALAELFRESWLHAYRGIIPHLHLESLVRKRTPNWWRRAVRAGDSLLVIEVAGEVAGYATCGAARTRGRWQGEIYELYIAPKFQGLGFGERLFEACRHSLDIRQLDGLIVWALAENTLASDFYWRRGGRPVLKCMERIGGTKFEKIAYGWH